MRVLIPFGGGLCLAQGLVLVFGAQTAATPWLTLIGAIMVIVGNFGGLYEDRKRYRDMIEKLKNQGPIEMRLEVKDG